MKNKKVLVSGCFDLLHAGHIQFLKDASSYGRLFVAVGTNKNLELLKKKAPYYSQEERVYIVKNVKCVEDAFIASGWGLLDFEPDLRRIKPDFFAVNKDGHSKEKEQLCEKHGVKYILLERIPPKGLPARASSEVKKELKFPYRIALAGGWIDQPWVSKVCAGSMVVASIFPKIDFHDRSGMATSSRKVAIELWGERLPNGNPERMAQLLFGAENPPGIEYVSGSQDHIGLLVPGISKLFYNGEYWPDKIESTRDKQTCEWLGNVLQLIPLKPRSLGYDPLEVKNLEHRWIKQLGESGELCYSSILKHDIKGLGESLNLSLEAWRKILPRTVLNSTLDEISQYSSHPGATFSGSGGGYILVASDKKIDGAVKIKIRY
jgi:cytidyltransferase-like protein